MGAMAVRGISLVFGVVVRKHRKARGLSQEALAEKANIHHTHVGLIERGERNSSLDVAYRIARALGLPLSALIAQAPCISQPIAASRMIEIYTHSPE